MIADTDIEDAVRRIQMTSPFLTRLLEQEPAIVESWRVALADPLAAAFAGLDEAPVARRLRVARRRLALAVALGDLAGAYPLEAVTGWLTAFADRALDIAIAAAITERAPDEAPRGVVALMLGKGGSHELNYSSDIDPILLYDPETLPRARRDDPEQAAQRIARRVVELLQARDGDGYVLRVDLRLRPAPEATPPALPVEAAIVHYESQALAWERAAFIRARAAAGDVALGRRFLETIRPFVWRRNLDFGAIREVQDLSRRIRDHYHEGQAFGPGYDLKRGRGGIREVEFYAQIHQLIHGGRDASLRAPATLDALAALAAAGRIEAGTATALGEAYRLLRTIEHRVQMIDDRQTHELPQGAKLDAVAALHGVENGAALLELLAPHVERVGHAYDALLPAAEGGLPHGGEALAARLAAAGFAEAEEAAKRIGGWRAGSYPALRSAAAQGALEAVLPGLVEALGAAAEPRAALIRLDGVFAKLPSAVNFLRLLEARPTLTRLTGAILSHAPTLAQALEGRVALLDGLIDASALEPVGSVAALAGAMRCDPGIAYEERLDHVRRMVGEKRFALGAQIVAGVADPLESSAGYGRVAEAAVAVAAEAAVESFAEAHGRVPDSELVVLALGRLGGGLLTHASDLDLIFLFTGDWAAESDGRRPLGAVHYYNRLAQRVIAALSVPTAAGRLYEVDTRLRPSGNQGPIAVSLEGFARYQRESAWTWEHMALTRARPVFGSEGAREALAGIIAGVLAGERPERDIAADARTMRAEMAAHKPPQGPLDAKLLPGGLVDLEFAVHTAQLTHRTGFSPDLRVAIAELGDRVPTGLGAAHDLLTRLLVTMRLVAPDAAPPGEATRALVARALDLPGWDAVVARLEASRQDVAAAWAQASGERDD